MRSSWERAEPGRVVNEDEVAEWAERALGGARVVSSRRLEGGLSNSNYWVRLAGGAEVRLRVYDRGRAVGEHELMVEKLVPRGVPVPRCLGAELEGAVPFAFFEWRVGRRLDQVFAEAQGEVRGALGEEVGSVLALIHARKFERTGFFGARGEVAAEFAADARGLREYAQRVLAEESPRSRLGEPLSQELLAWLEEGSRVLDDAGTPGLSHGDFGGSNLLIEEHSPAWRVSGVLDWEYACSGFAAFDFGNLLRAPLGDDVRFVEGVALGYRAQGGTLGPNFRQAARAADLFAALSMLERRKLHESVVRSLRERVVITLRADG